jgi:YNFM family putative membrane transporter
VTGLVMTAALLGFAAAGLLPEAAPGRTLRMAVALIVAGSVLAAASSDVEVLLLARAGQGVGIGQLVAGGLALVPRRVAAGAASRYTGALIAGTALGGLCSRLVGYVGNFLSWRGAFVAGGAAVLVVATLSLRALRLDGPATTAPGGAEPTRSPWSVVVPGFFILFVSVGMFDLLPYRLSAAPFHLPTDLADLVYLAFVPSTAAGFVAGWALQRLKPRTVILTTCALSIGLMLVGLLPSLVAVGLAATAAICGTVSLQVAHSGAAAVFGRAAVGRYLAAYYVGGAAAAPILASTYVRWGWPGAVLPMCGATLIVAALSLSRSPQVAEPRR